MYRFVHLDENVQISKKEKKERDYTDRRNAFILLSSALFCNELQKSAQGGTWTPTALRPTDFKSAASTNSATRANQIIYYSTLGIESRKL